MHNQSINLTGNSRVVKRRAIPRPAGYFTVGPGSSAIYFTVGQRKIMNDLIPKSDWSEIEVYKIEFEYLKHLTTISTGSILLIVAFMEKIFKHPEAKYLIAISLCCFLGSISFCAFSQLTIIEKASEKVNATLIKTVQNWTVGLMFIALGMYVVGIICLVIFGIKNLF